MNLIIQLTEGVDRHILLSLIYVSEARMTQMFTLKRGAQVRWFSFIYHLREESLGSILDCVLMEHYQR